MVYLQSNKSLTDNAFDHLFLEELFVTQKNINAHDRDFKVLHECMYVQFPKWGLMFSFINAYDVGLSGSISLDVRQVKRKLVK